MVHEIVFGQPGKAQLVDVQMGECGRRRALRQQRADRLALVQAEGRDVDQAGDVRRVRAESRDDLAAVGVAGDDGRAILAVQHLPQPGDVVGQGRLRELGCGDGEAGGLQALDDGAPAGAVGPCAVDEDDVRQGIPRA